MKTVVLTQSVDKAEDKESDRVKKLCERASNLKIDEHTIRKLVKSREIKKIEYALSGLKHYLSTGKEVKNRAGWLLQAVSSEWRFDSLEEEKKAREARERRLREHEERKKAEKDAWEREIKSREVGKRLWKRISDDDKQKMIEKKRSTSDLLSLETIILCLQTELGEKHLGYNSEPINEIGFQIKELSKKLSICEVS